jgi:type II protein arginine methyltransferase
MENHYKYLCHVFSKHDELEEEDKLEVSYRNYLQSPLQPLADNLESSTYETFENDTIKYELYEQSCYKAYMDKMRTGKFAQTAGTPGGNAVEKVETEELPFKDEPIIVMYFGAGRGPLIRRALSAAKKAGANVHVVALDKNPNAIVTLRNMIVDEKLQDCVTLIAGDMRKINLDKLKGDILMSELLGSFGDNELSPECLIPTEKYLKPGGIYLPYSYTN